MKPQNEKQRNDLFLKHSLMFLTTIVMITIVLFTSFKMPDQQCEYYQKKVEQLEQLKATHESVLADFDSALAIIKKYDLSDDKSNNEIDVNKYASNIQKIETEKNLNELYKRIGKTINVFIDYKKENFKNYEKCSSELEELKKYKEKVEKKATTITNYLNGISVSDQADWITKVRPGLVKSIDDLK